MIYKHHFIFFVHFFILLFKFPIHFIYSIVSIFYKINLDTLKNLQLYRYPYQNTSTPLCQVLDTYFFQISNQLFLLYFNFKIGFFKSLFIRSAYTTWSTTSDIVVILCPASLEDAPQWYILCLSVFQSMIIYLSWNSPPDF